MASFRQSLVQFFGGTQLKAAAPLLGAMLPVANPSAKWMTVDYASVAREGYRNPYVYAAISQISLAFAGIRWTVYESEDKDKELKDHPLAALLKRPNQRQGHSQFFENMMAYLLLDGNSFLYAIGPDVGPPRELYCLRPDRVEVIPGSVASPVAGYLYGVPGQRRVPIPEELVRHLKLFNPLDDFRGMSPMTAAAMSVDSSNAAKTWNVALLQNAARPTGALMSQTKLAPDTYERLKNLIAEEYSGFLNAGRPLLLEGGITWQEMGINPKDMEWLEGQKLSAREIAIVFNIAPELLADSTNKTYSNYGEGRLALYQENVLPKSDVVRDELNAWLVPLYGGGVYIDYVRDDIEALQEDRNKVWDRVDKAVNTGWIKINDARKEVALEEDPDKGDQYLWEAKASVAPKPAPNPSGPVDATGKPIITEEKPPALPPGNNPDSTSDESGQSQGDIAPASEGGKGAAGKAALPFRSWSYPDTKAATSAKGYIRAVHTARDRWIKKVRPMIQDQYAADRETLRQALRTTNMAGAPDKIVSTLTGHGVQQEWINLYADIAMTVGYDFAGNTQNHMADRFGYSIPRNSEDAVKTRLSRYVLARIPDRVNTMLVNTAKRALTDYVALRGVKAIVRPASIDTLDDLDAFLDDLYIGFADEGADALAQHEVDTNSNVGQFVGADEMGDLRLDKVWMATLDNRTREWHAEMDGVAVALDETFDVDGEPMLYPLDDASGATGKNLYNCRCTTYYQPAG